MQAILYTFPAVCWVYGAGAIFSSFVSLIFWFAPAKIACYRIRSAIVVVHPVGLKVNPLPCIQSYEALYAASQYLSNMADPCFQGVEKCLIAIPE